MPPSRPALVRTTAAACAVAIGTLAAVGAPDLASAGADKTKPSAQAKYEAAMKAVGHKGVHFTSLASQNGVTVSVSGDTGASSGQQKLVVRNGALTERMHALVVGSTGYVKANNAALHHVIGLSTSKSSKYSGTWLSFPTSNSGLAQLVTGLLNSQVASELEMSGPYHYGKTATVGGQHALTIHGYESTQSGGQIETVLYVPATGRPLPIQEVTNPGTKGGHSAIRGKVTFSKWGQKTAQHKPAHSVSLLKIVPTANGSATTTTKG